MIKHPPTAVILLAGGRSTRMKDSTPKPFMLLDGKPIFQYSLDVFFSLNYVVEVVIVCASEFQHRFPQPPKDIIRTLAKPGERRQDSVFNGLNALQTTPQLVAIHDSARPFITTDMIDRITAAAAQHGAALAAVPVKPTIKIANEHGIVDHTPDRSKLWEAQTPQIINYQLLKSASHHFNTPQTYTDDVALVEFVQHPVSLVMGSYSNIKITTPEDLAIASAFLAQK